MSLANSPHRADICRIYIRITRRMTLDETAFREWQEQMKITAVQAAKLLGKSPDTISRYRTTGVPASEALVVGLACSALAMGLRPWGAYSEAR